MINGVVVGVEWQRLMEAVKKYPLVEGLFEDMSLEELNGAATAFSKSNPYSGKELISSNSRI